MRNNQKPANRNKRKANKPEKSNSGAMKIFYIFMLLLLLSGSLIRFASASRNNSQSKGTPTSQIIPGVGSTAARLLSFHREDSQAGTCRELVIPASGSAVYSDCGTGPEKQYDLSEAERTELQGWIEQFQPINYDHADQTQPGGVSTQMFLNGRGSQPADAMETLQIINYADALAAKIASQP